jgi:hypothetical protein
MVELTPSEDEVLDFDPRSLPQDYLAAIGLMSAAASSTESIVEMAIAGMLGIDSEQGYAVTCHMSAPLRSSVLKSAAEIVINNRYALDDLDERLERIRRATEARNDVIHGSWAVRHSDNTVFLVQLEARTHVDIKSQPLKVDEIKGKAIELYESGISLMSFIRSLNKLPAMPRERDRVVNTPKARKAARKKDA